MLGLMKWLKTKKLKMDNHEQIHEKLGKLETGVEFLVGDAKKKNGYIDDLKKRDEIHDQRINDTQKIIIEFKNAMEQTFTFMKDQRDEKKEKESLKGRFKENWILFVTTTLTGMFIVTYLPLFWMWIKRLLFQ